ncbi:hypothetical protein [Nannocystis punicea]|uniref:Antitoxin Xre/MbcA/ParS-like toxin-binding domain-containing protein n=1 Tax=Nannocystis punicea TaxID=2995304 RepID=A0ABY7HAM5_9BACT|nr:hypothetical protein [Nannocystis poenicansa]WAS96094.1 hypothetical protein O0S08_08010 [Nannocystis poenicansa]
MTELEDIDSGDEAWERFAALFRGQTALHAAGEALKRQLGGDEALANVILASVGDAALGWIGQRNPALSGLSPCECLASEKTLKRLREMLLRFPR